VFNSENATKNISAIVRLNDGTSLSGSLVIAMSSDLPRTLNGDGQFLEFEAVNGQRSFIAKTSIAQATPNEIPKAKKLDAGADSDEDFNPYRVLKVKPGSKIEDIRAAYYSRAKLYHPDRFSATELPPEMAKYAENMCRLINAAFQVLDAEASAGNKAAC
jgi:hypothetical protein